MPSHLKSHPCLADGRYRFLRGGPGRGTLLGSLFLHIGVDDGLAPRELLHVQLRLFFWVGAAEPLSHLLRFLEDLGGLAIRLNWIGLAWVWLV